MSDVAGEHSSSRRDRLHVLAVAGAYPKLSETFVHRQVEALRHAGHRVTVIAGKPAAGEMPLDDPLPAGLRVLHLPARPAGVVRRRAQAVWTVLRSFRRGPRATWRVLTRRSLTWHERWLTLQTLLLVRELPDLDVAHAHFGPYGARQMEVFAALGRPVPVVTAFHGIDITLPLVEQGPDVYDRLFRHGARFLPISDYWRQRLIELGAPPERTLVHRMGVPLDELVVCARSPSDELRVLSIGRLVEKKGFDDGLAAIDRARHDGSSARWTIVGDGPERDRLARLAQELGVEEYVTFLGAVPHDQTLELLATHDVLLCPSRTATDGDQEGIPVVLMEAMATGMPVVATRHSGIPELVEHGRSGLLADERDTVGLARSLAQLEAEPSERQRLGLEGRRKVERHFASVALDRALEQILIDVADAG